MARHNVNTCWLSIPLATRCTNWGIVPRENDEFVLMNNDSHPPSRGWRDTLNSKIIRNFYFAKTSIKIKNFVFFIIPKPNYRYVTHYPKIPTVPLKRWILRSHAFLTIVWSDKHTRRAHALNYDWWPRGNTHKKKPTMFLAAKQIGWP